MAAPFLRAYWVEYGVFVVAPGPYYSFDLVPTASFTDYFAGSLAVLIDDSADLLETFAKYAFRFASGDVFRYLSDGSWVPVGDPNITGMTKADVEAANAGKDWERPGGFNPSSPWLEVRAFFRSTNPNRTPKLLRAEAIYKGVIGQVFPTGYRYRVRLAPKTDYANFFKMPTGAVEMSGASGDWRAAIRFSATDVDRFFDGDSWEAVVNRDADTMLPTTVFNLNNDNWTATGGFNAGAPFKEVVVFPRTDDPAIGATLDLVPMRYLKAGFGGAPSAPDHEFVDGANLVDLRPPTRQEDKVVTQVLVRGRKGQPIQVAGAPAVLATDTFTLNPGQFLQRQITIPNSIADNSLVHEVQIVEPVGYSYVERTNFFYSQCGSYSILFYFQNPTSGTRFFGLRGPNANDPGQPRFIGNAPRMIFEYRQKGRINIWGLYAAPVSGGSHWRLEFSDDFYGNEDQPTRAAQIDFLPSPPLVAVLTAQENNDSTCQTSFKLGVISISAQMPGGGQPSPLGGQQGFFGGVPMTERALSEVAGARYISVNDADNDGIRIAGSCYVYDPDSPPPCSGTLMTVGNPIVIGNVPTIKNALTTATNYVVDVGASTWQQDQVHVTIEPRGKAWSQPRPQITFLSGRNDAAMAAHGTRELLIENESIADLAEAEAISQSLLIAGSSAPTMWEWTAPGRPHAEAGDSARLKFTRPDRVASFGQFSPILYILEVIHRFRVAVEGSMRKVTYVTLFKAIEFAKSALQVMRNFGVTSVKERADVQAEHLRGFLFARVVRVIPGTGGPGVTDTNLYDVTMLTDAERPIILSVPNAHPDPYGVGDTVFIEFHRGDRGRPFLSGRAPLVSLEAGDITQSPASAPTITTRLQIKENILPDGQVSVAYLAELNAIGGLGTSFTWSVPYGALPTGLSLTQNGSRKAFIGGGSYGSSGTPAASGAFSFAIRVVDDLGNIDIHDYRVEIT